MKRLPLAQASTLERPLSALITCTFTGQAHACAQSEQLLICAKRSAREETKLILFSYKILLFNLLFESFHRAYIAEHANNFSHDMWI